MDWLIQLVSEPSPIQAVIWLSVICAIGLGLGGIKIKGVFLGTAFVFFAGIFLGDILNRLGIKVDSQMIGFAQNFGLVLFVYSLGVQVGPGFFSSLKQGGMRLNLYGLFAIVLTTVFALSFSMLNAVGFTDSIGLLCGAVTNTPMLGAAQQSFLDVHPDDLATANNMATACALGYPCGVLGVLVCMIVFKQIYKKKGTPDHKNSVDDTYVAEFHVSNPAVFNHKVGRLSEYTDRHVIISRIWKNGKVIIPSSDTVLEKDDHLLAVLHKDDLTTFKVIFGEEEKTDWNKPDIDWNHIDESNLVSRHILVTKSELNGVKLGSLHLRNSFDINITRVNRAGIQLVAYPGMRLQLGDRLTVVGTEAAVAKVAEILGNQEKVLNTPNLVSIFVGMLLGVVIGSIPFFLPGMSTPVKLGIAGGPIIVGILMGAFGPSIHLSTYATRSANLMLRQIGLVIYLACLGFSAGPGFVELVFSTTGLVWLGVSLTIAIVPVLVAGLVAMRFGKLDYAQNAGMLCAAMANPIALTYANSISDEDEASESYATVYPLSMFVRVISVQLIMLLFI
ncbi:MAG: putative transporter [Bacteroidales bacterium]|nr:putative transporter [Candidatus Cryptobacteroides equifaecalis]